MDAAPQFSVASGYDECKCRQHPLEFRLRNLKNERLRDVLSAAAKAFGWASRRKTAGVGHGIAGGFEKGSYLATCAEIRMGPSREMKVVRLVSAFDCGASVNPDQLKNQVEGAMVQGLGGALFEAIEFTNGVLDNGSFSKYRVPRFRDLSAMEVVLLDRSARRWGR
jgi:isoquinoline 1-oxidoreductase